MSGRRAAVCRPAVWIALLLAWGIFTRGAPAGERPGDDLFSVTFVSATEGWASGRWGTVLHTADGGRTWERQETGVDYTLASVSFADPRNGWAVGDEGTILRTADGGRSWRRQDSPVPYFLMGVAFVTPEEGWIVTERTTILHTDDGGRTWEVQLRDEDFILRSVSFCDRRTGWAVGEFGYIYRTGDGGRTWVRQAGEFDISEETGEIVGGNFLFDVDAVSPREAWVVGIDGYVARTLDGGATWEVLTEGVPKTHLFGVRAEPGGGPVVVVGDATLLTSGDRGATWRPARATPPVTYGWLYRIAARGTAGLVAVGKEGWVYSAGPDGRTWKRSRDR